VTGLLAIQRYLHPNWNVEEVVASVITLNQDMEFCRGRIALQFIVDVPIGTALVTSKLSSSLTFSSESMMSMTTNSAFSSSLPSSMEYEDA
jgi:hypothetical protein